MVIYVESVLAFNFLLDYLLLFGAARLAGRTVARRRLLRGAAVGGAYAAVQLFLPRSALLLLLALALMGAAAFSGSGRAVKLTLLFFLVSCGFGGTVVLLGQGTGAMTRLARGVVAADLPWGVFLLAAGLSYLLISVVFRFGAARTGVAVIDRHALGDLVSEKEAAALPRIPYCSVGQTDGTLPLLHCEGIILDGKDLGARSVALTERPPGDGGAYAGLWCEGCEKGEKDAATTQTAMG